MGKSGIVILNHLARLIRFGIYSSLFFGLIFYIDTNQIIPTQLLAGFLFGVSIGILDDLSYHRKVVSRSLAFQYTVKVVGLAVMMAIVALRAITVRTPIEEIDFQFIAEGFGERRIANYLMSAFIVAITISMYFQMEKLVGKNRLLNYLKGNYRKPKKEIRIFLFMDLKSSTSLSEKLGNDTYYAFLNDAIYEMSEAIIISGAEIYQYVGDEIVFTWTLDSGIRNNRCIQLFESITKRLEDRQGYFMKHYGYKPEFKGAMHAGLVLAAEIGHIRREIVYSGDVLNTTARMESLCNQFNASLLISKSLFNLLDKKHNLYFEELGPVALKGKDETIELLKMHPSRSHTVSVPVEV